MQRCMTQIDNFVHGTWIVSQSCTYTQSSCEIGESMNLRNTLYTTLVQGPDMKHIGKIMKRAVGRMIRLWIYKTLKVMKIAWVFWYVGNWMIVILGLSEAMEALDVGGRHLGRQFVQCGLYEDDEEESKLMIFG